jgi:HSP20 family protein
MKPFLPTLFGRGGIPAETDDPFRALRRQMDDMLSDFSRGFPGWPAATQGDIAPRMDVSETENEYVVTAELPGIDEKDIEVTMSDDMLTIKGEKKTEEKKEDEHYHLVERSYGSVMRQIALPNEVAADKIAAEFDKGVLRITLPKSPQAAEKTRKIAVKAK